ncbi:amino acid ABC transporter permease, partial [Candidatus Acetothermia bacterium]
MDLNILQLIRDSLPALLRGAKVTAELVGGCLGIGFGVGVPLAL